MQPEPESNKTFKELLDTLPDQAPIEKYKVLKECLAQNTEDNPSTKDMLDAVKKIGTTTDPSPTSFLNMTSSLVETYLTCKEITKEQSSVNPLEALQNIFADPSKTVNNIYKDAEDSILGLSEESKSVRKIITKTLDPQERYDVEQSNNFKKNILKTYFENHNVTYNDFKNLLRLTQIDDPQSQTELLVSFLKRSNLDESKFVENVNDFLQNNDRLVATHKVTILEEYLAGKNKEITPDDHDKVLNLAKNIGLELSKNSEGRTGPDVVKLQLEVVVGNINRKIDTIRPNPGVAATSSTSGAVDTRPSNVRGS